MRSFLFAICRYVEVADRYSNCGRRKKTAQASLGGDDIVIQRGKLKYLNVDVIIGFGQNDSSILSSNIQRHGAPLTRQRLEIL